MKHNGYFAVVLDDTWTDVVRKNATMDVVRGDHITIAYKPDNTTFENLRDIMGISDQEILDNISPFNDPEDPATLEEVQTFYGANGGLASMFTRRG